MRDYDKDGVSVDKVSFKNVKLPQGNHSAELNTSFDSRLIIKSTEALSSEYRIEYTLRNMDFGGQRNGSFEYDGKYNGYVTDESKSNFPWKRDGDFSGKSSHENYNFGEVIDENGYYLLCIMDYENPAPHNNMFFHNHRKVEVDAYNVNASWASNYGICNPESHEIYGHTDPKSTNNTVNGFCWRQVQR